MKSVEARFGAIKENNPYWADWVSFAVAITNQKMSSRTIRQWFKKLVPKDDYPQGDIKQAVTFMWLLSNPLRATHDIEKSPQNRGS